MTKVQLRCAACGFQAFVSSAAEAAAWLPKTANPSDPVICPACRQKGGAKINNGESDTLARDERAS